MASIQIILYPNVVTMNVITNTMITLRFLSHSQFELVMDYPVVEFQMLFPLQYISLAC